MKTTSTQLYVFAILRGFGQILLQNNALSGLLFLIGVFYNSLVMAIGAIIGALISTCTAILLRYSKNDIENGLYGFNGALIGIAICFFFGFNVTTFLFIAVGSLVSSILARIINKQIPGYTSPFVVITWGIIFCMKSLMTIPFQMASLPEMNSLSLFSALSNGFGQVMFQMNTITGLFFFLAVLINSRVAAFYAVYGSILGALVAIVLSLPLTMINAGLFGYNAILCAIALGDKKWISFLLVTVSVILSVLLNVILMKINVISLTAPFVIATWLILLIKNKFSKRFQV